MAYKVFSNGNTLPASDLNTYLMNQSVIAFASTTARDAAIPSPNEGMLVWLEDSNKYVQFNGTAWVDLIDQATIAGYAPRGNAIINGAFDIWQRGTTVNLSAAGGYVADRWKSDSGSGGVLAVTRQTFTPGQTDVPNATYYLQAAYTTSGTGTVVLEQRIEDVNTFAGQTVTFSFYAKVNTGTKSVTPRFVQDFGSGGSTTVVTNMTAQTLTTSWQRFTVTSTVPSITGKTVGSSSYLRVDFDSGTSGVITFSFANIQLEAGSVATPFKRNAPSIQAELAACKRYCRVFTDPNKDYALVTTRTSTTQAQAVYSLGTEMRVTPTISFSAAQYGRIVFYDTSFNVAAQNVTTLAIDNGPSLSEVNLLFTHAAQSGTYVQSSFDTQSNGSLMIMSAEL